MFCVTRIEPSATPRLVLSLRRDSWLHHSQEGDHPEDARTAEPPRSKAPVLGVQLQESLATTSSGWTHAPCEGVLGPLCQGESETSKDQQQCGAGAGQAGEHGFTSDALDPEHDQSEGGGEAGHVRQCGWAINATCEPNRTRLLAALSPLVGGWGCVEGEREGEGQGREAEGAFNKEWMSKYSSLELHPQWWAKSPIVH